MLPLLLWSVRETGVVGAAWSLVAVASVVLAGTLSAATRLLSLSPGLLLSRVWRSFVAASAMAVAVVLLQGQWVQLESHVERAALVFACIVSGTAIYLMTLWILWLTAGVDGDPEPEAVRLLRRFF
jgi:hypothetical protein